MSFLKSRLVSSSFFLLLKGLCRVIETGHFFSTPLKFIVPKDFMFYDIDYNRIAHNDKVILDLSMCEEFEYNYELQCTASYENDSKIVFYDQDGLGYAFSKEDESIQLNFVSSLEYTDKDTGSLV